MTTNTPRRGEALTLEQLRDYLDRCANECNQILLDDVYRAPEHPSKLKPDTRRMIATRRILHEELVQIIDEGKLPS